jgi:hypothetical protein
LPLTGTGAAPAGPAVADGPARATEGSDPALADRSTDAARGAGRASGDGRPAVPESTGSDR